MITGCAWPVESCRKGANFPVQWMQVEYSQMKCQISKDSMSRYPMHAVVSITAIINNDNNDRDYQVWWQEVHKSTQSKFFDSPQYS